MKKQYIIFSLLFVFLSVLSIAQTTSVTGTIISFDGYPYANGTVTATLTAPTGNINCALYNINGTPMGGPSTPCTVKATMNGSGVFTMTLTDDHIIKPSGTIWSFTVCSLATGSCSSSLQDVFGTSINLSTLINNTIPALSGFAQPTTLYNTDIEVANSSLGSSYYNIQDQTLHYCFTLPCTTSSNWKSIGSGGGGGSGVVGTGSQYQIPIYPANGTTVQGDSNLTDNGNTLSYTGSLGFSTNYANISNILNVGSSPPTACGAALGCMAFANNTIVGNNISGQSYIRATGSGFICNNGAGEYACSSATAVTSFTGDSAGLFNNSGSTGNVTLSIAHTPTGTGGIIVESVSPALTGTPTAPTQTAGDSTTKIATDAFVQNAVAGGVGVTSFNGRSGAVIGLNGDYSVGQITGAAPIFSPDFTGNPQGVTQTTSDNTLSLATDAFVHNVAATLVTGVSSFNSRTGAISPTSGDYSVGQVTGAAPLASPTLTGSPTAPTQTTGDNSTDIATDQFVQTAVSSVTAGVSSFNTRTGAVVPTSGDYTVSQVTGAAPLASPTLTGSPKSVTQSTSDNSTDIATDAYVQNNLASYLTTSSASATYAPLASPALTGSPTTPTQTTSDNTTKIASDAYVQNNLANYQTAATAQAAYSGIGSCTSVVVSVNANTAPTCSNTVTLGVNGTTNGTLTIASSLSGNSLSLTENGSTTGATIKAGGTSENLTLSSTGTSNIILSPGGYVQFNAGSSSQPSIALATGTTSGIFQASAATISAACSASECARFQTGGIQLGTKGILLGSGFGSTDTSMLRAGANVLYVGQSSTTTDATGIIHAAGNTVLQSGGNQTAVTATTCCTTWLTLSLPSIAAAELYNFECFIPYTLVGTATVPTFGVEVGTNSPTSVALAGFFNGQTETYTQASSPTTTTWTSITGSSQTAGTYVGHFQLSLEVPSSKAIAINFGTSMTTGTSIAIQRGGNCFQKL